MVEIPFYSINVNSGREGLEIVFNYNRKWYRLKWDKVPEKFKTLYVATLKLQGLKIPDYLKKYEKDIVNVSDLSIEIDLNECEEIPETYPL